MKTHPTIKVEKEKLDELTDVIEELQKLQAKEKELKDYIRPIAFEEFLKHKQTSSVITEGGKKNYMISFTERWTGWDVNEAQNTLPPVLTKHVNTVIDVKVDLSKLAPNVQAIVAKAIELAIEETGVDVKPVITKKVYPKKSYTDERKNLTLEENLDIEDVFKTPSVIKAIK